ncbi:MAG TPA: GNAT family N-acetyltransferase [Bacteroidia bacterium]|jgi:GNAT superfamily N-acetyltransferase|nr:GNAT family N-acetyltransferase [Bacteroidia bacterium]
MTEKIEIRTGEKADLPNILNLIKELADYEKAPAEVEVTVSEMENWGFGENKLFDFFVAEQNEVIVGLALFYYKYSTWKGKCLFLEDIIVTEKLRGKGIGKNLFDKIVEVAKKEKVRRLEWQVLNWNKPAIKFYEKYNANLDPEWLNGKLTNHQLEKL